MVASGAVVVNGAMVASGAVVVASGVVANGAGGGERVRPHCKTKGRAAL
uniref:Uncharacterized protein n=1 Tax=Peronospora matthiolae TaxID=2874970 RepID=A0AAV1TIZ3_9STRA